MKKYLIFFLTLASCTQTERPLDADERQFIDSVSNAQIRAFREKIDSQYQAAQKTELPHLVDSILKQRRREIKESLDKIPR